MNKRLMLPMLAVLLAACGSSEKSAEQKIQDAQTAVVLFAASCAANDGHPAQVAAWAAQQQAGALTPEQVKQLPFGLIEPDAQAVWKLEKNGSAFYLTLTADSCSLKAEKADEATVRSEFEKLLRQGRTGVNVELRIDKATQSPFPFSQLSYAWRAAGSPDETLLTANTSVSDKLPAQAVLTLTHQSYQNTAPVLSQ
ncbi:NMCC_0638 family (lipo)protein [Neisseria perflava]|uniref:NMCC_0638 family (lipo)protein n=1 Tax=Neisseria perflava TaxID=33053 RepID=UPI0020A06A1C|nr:hypothetical protein [Neisseria perflava]MCP1661206.1 hypothetical protein [Neisseria perflava]